jgi:hypothetical protein
MGTMPTTLKPGGQAMLIGSQPLDNHDQATRLVFDNIPAIPNWVQLPVYPHEGMVKVCADILLDKLFQFHSTSKSSSRL